MLNFKKWHTLVFYINIPKKVFPHEEVWIWRLNYGGNIIGFLWQWKIPKSKPMVLLIRFFVSFEAFKRSLNNAWDDFNSIFTHSNFVISSQSNNHDNDSLLARNQYFPIVTLYRIVFPETCTRDLPIPIRQFLLKHIRRR